MIKVNVSICRGNDDKSQPKKNLRSAQSNISHLEDSQDNDDAKDSNCGNRYNQDVIRIALKRSTREDTTELAK